MVYIWKGVSFAEWCSQGKEGVILRSELRRKTGLPVTGNKRMGVDADSFGRRTKMNHPMHTDNLGVSMPLLVNFADRSSRWKERDLLRCAKDGPESKGKVNVESALWIKAALVARDQVSRL